MKFSSSALLSMLILANSHPADAFSPPQSFISRRSTATLRMSSYTSAETVAKFNQDFKQGLKFILVPQHKDVRMPSYYDDHPLPDLEAPGPVASVDTLVAKAAPPVASVAPPSVEEAMSQAREIIASSDSGSARMSSSQYSYEPTIPQAAPPSVEEAMAQAKEIIANVDNSSPVKSLYGLYPNEPSKFLSHVRSELGVSGVDPAYGRLVDKFSHPDPSALNYGTGGTVSSVHFSLPQAPDGLTTSISDYVTRTLSDAHDAHLNFARNLTPEPSLASQRVLGLDVKSSLVDALTATSVETKSAIKNGLSYFGQNFEESLQRSAPFRSQIGATLTPMRENTRATLLHNMETMQSNADALFKGAPAAGDSIRNGILHNGDLMRTQVSHNMEALQNFDWHLDKVQQTLQTPGWKMNDLIEALNMKEMGGWYAGVAIGALMLAAAQEQQQRKKDTPLGQDPQVSVKPTPQSTPAIKTPPTINSPPSSAQPVSPDIALIQQQAAAADKQQLEGLVFELTEAVAILTNELKDLKTKRAKTDYDLAAMKSDVRSVKNEVEVKAKEVDMAAMLQESKAHNDMLQHRLEIAKLEADALAEVKEVMASIDKQSDLDPHPPSVPPPQPLEAAAVAAVVEDLAVKEMQAANVVETATQEVKDIKAKKVSTDPDFFGGTEVFFANIVDTVLGTDKKKKEKPVPAVTDDTLDDWGNLPLSAIKNKPSSEIASYLQQRGMPVTDENGNPLKKPDLLKTILAVA